MAYQDIPEKQEFSAEVYKIDPEDLVHADLMNEIVSKLLTNEVFLKAVTEGHIEGKNNSAGSKHIPSGGASGQVLKYGGVSGTAEWGESAANCVTLWQGVIYESGEWIRFYVPEQYWHNNTLTLMIDCVKYQYDESAFVKPPHSKTVIAALTLPHNLYVTEGNEVKLRAYTAAYNQNGKVNRYSVSENFSSDTDDIICIEVEARSLATTDYAEVSVFKSDARPYVITDIYAVIPQAQEQEG